MPARPIEIVTPPSSEPVSTADLISLLRLNDDEESELLDQFISEARDLFERETRRHVLETTVREWFPGFTATMELSRGIVAELAAVKYYAAGDDELSTLEGARIFTGGIPALVDFPGVALPAIDTTRRYPVAIEYVCGWESAQAVPVTVCKAIKLLAGHFYRYREAFIDSASELRTMPMGFQRVVEHFKTGLGEWG